VRTLAQRLGITIIETRLLRADDETSLPDGPFDYALADVPCSNTGVLGRRPEVRWRLHPDDIAELVRLQRRLLEQAARRVRLGGALVRAYPADRLPPRSGRSGTSRSSR
jgi:16S rRNA (cytosine967-C5)-methyltransferase